MGWIIISGASVQSSQATSDLSTHRTRDVEIDFMWRHPHHVFLRVLQILTMEN